MFSSAARVVVPLVAAAFCACAGGSPTESSEPPPVPEGPAPPPPPAGPALVECPSQPTQTVTQTLGLLGGVLQVAGNSLVVPVSALLTGTQFTMTVPSSRFVEVHITANGAHSFGFLTAATITISYAHCSSTVAGAQLKVYKIDPTTKALLKEMPSTDVKLERHITFQTDSLSGYAIAQ